MAYQARRKKLYTEEFELVNENGTVVHTLKVELEPDTVAKRLSEKQVALMRASRECDKAIENLKESTENVENLKANENLEIFGHAIVDLMEACFGKKDTAVILEFYEHRYMELCKEVVPFITQVVIPEVRKMASQNKKAALSGYNRKQRRSFLRG